MTLTFAITLHGHQVSKDRTLIDGNSIHEKYKYHGIRRLHPKYHRRQGWHIPYARSHPDAQG